MHFIIIVALLMLLLQIQPKCPAKVTEANDGTGVSNVGLQTPSSLCTHHITDAIIKNFFLLCSQGAF